MAAQARSCNHPEHSQLLPEQDQPFDRALMGGKGRQLRKIFVKRNTTSVEYFFFNEECPRLGGGKKKKKKKLISNNSPFSKR